MNKFVLAALIGAIAVNTVDGKKSHHKYEDEALMENEEPALNNVS